MAEKELRSDEVPLEEVHTEEVEIFQKDSTVFCDPCLENGENITSERFCVDCNDYLCSECVNLHKKLRATRGHMLKDNADMPVSKPVKVHAIEICSEHKFEIVTHYCQSHDQVLCRLCKQISHRNCTHIQTIDDICLDFENTEEIKQIKHQLESLQIEFKENRDIAGDHKAKAEAYYQHAISGMRAIRDKDLQMMCAIENTCETVSPQITALMNDLDINGNNKRLKLLMTLKAKFQTNILKGQLSSVKQDNNIARYKFVPSVHSDDLGVIKKCPFKLENICVKTSSDKHDCAITDMERFSDNSLIMADNRNLSIKVVDMSSKTVTKQIMISEPPWCLAKIDDKLIAVTTHSKQKILIVSTTATTPVQKTINKNEFRQCRGIVCTKDTLTVCYQDPDLIEKLDLDGTVKQTIDYKKKQEMVQFCNRMYMKRNHDTNILYLLDYELNKVHSFTADGTLLASFSHENLKNPRGLSLDGNRRIFVCSTDNVFEISSDLLVGKIVLDGTDGITAPYSVMYDDEQDKLFVGSYNNNTIQVFMV